MWPFRFDDSESDEFPEPPEDMLNEVCSECQGGRFALHDDWENLVECSECGHVVERHPDLP